MPDQTVLISEPFVVSLLGNEQFYTVMPEFLQLKPKLQTMNLSITSLKSGCGACTQRRINATILKDFLILLQSLPKDSIDRFKEFIGAKTIMINLPGTGMQNQVKLL